MALPPLGSLPVIPTPGLSSIPGANAASNFLGSLQNRLVTAPGGVEDIAGFIFDYAGEASSDLEADITDHWTENNAAIQDHVALRPVRVRLRGFVAELVQKVTGAGALIGSVQSILTQVPAYTGGYTPQALQTVGKALTQAQNYQNQVNQYIGQGKSLFGLFANSPATQTRQEKAYAQLEALWASRQVFALVTPWRIYPSMVIERLHPVQPESTRDMTDFTITLKQLNFAQTLAIPNYLSTFAGRAALMQQGTTVLGQQPPTKAATSILYGAFSGALK